MHENKIIDSCWAALLGRLGLAAIFIISGFGKILGFDQTVAFAAAYQVPLPELAIVLTIVIELIGGVLLAVGLWTRWAALCIGLFLIPVTLVFHSNFEDQMQMTQFLKNLAIIGGMLMVVAHGPGGISIDRRRLRTTAPVMQSM